MKISEESIDNLPLYSNKKSKKKTEELIFSENVNVLCLSVRSENCLAQLKIKTLNELLKLKPHQLLMIRNFGKKSLNEIKERVRWHLLQYVDKSISMPTTNDNVITKDEFKNKEVSEEYLNELPLFSNKTLYKNVILHPTYKPNESLYKLGLTIRAMNCLMKMKFETIHELLLITSYQLLMIRDCGKKTLIEIQSTIKNFLLINSINSNKTFNSFDCLLGQLINSKERNIEIFKNRLGVGFKKPQTLEESGKDFGITRERTRQVLNLIEKKINNDCNINLLKYFSDAVDSSLSKYNGAVYYDDIASDICNTLNWNDKIEGHVIAEFVNYFTNKYFFDHQNKIICLKKDKCLKCNLFWKNLIILVNDKGKLSVEEATSDIQYFCRTNCAEKMYDKKINKGMVLYYLSVNTKEIIYEKKLLYSQKEYIKKRDIEKKQKLREQGSIFILIEDILKKADKPLSKKEIELKLIEKGKGIKYHIASIMQKCENILKWNRGVYIHRDNIQISKDLLKNIFLYIKDEFTNEIPFLTINKVFNKFEYACKAEKISTDIALYSVLLVYSRFEYTLPQFPAIFLTENYEDQTIHSELEKYLLVKTGPADYKLMRKFFVKNVGIKKKSFNWHINNNENIVKLSDVEIIHIKYLPESYSKPFVKNTHKIEVEDNVPSIDNNYIIDIIHLCEIHKLLLTDNQKKIIKLFQEHSLSMSKMRLLLFSRASKLNGQNLINSINEKFIKEFNARLVITEDYTMRINEKFLEETEWK